MAYSNGAGRILDCDGVETPNWLSQVRQQIQVLDYELHALLRIVAVSKMESEHMTAFMDATAQRDRLMARVVTYVSQAAHSKGYG